MTENKKIRVAQIGKPHGVRGQFMMRVFVDDIGLVLNDHGITDQSGQKTFIITKCDPHKKAFLSAIQGVDDRTAIENLRGLELFIDRADLPEVEGDEVYNVDLVGLEARLQDGSIIGVIGSVENYGASDLFDIRRDGAKDAMIPYTDETVIEINVDDRYVILNPPEGLMELYD